MPKSQPRAYSRYTVDAASLLGVPLFGSDAKALAEKLQHTEEHLALLPSSIRKTVAVLSDDF